MNSFCVQISFWQYFQKVCFYFLCICSEFVLVFDLTKQCLQTISCWVFAANNQNSSNFPTSKLFPSNLLQVSWTSTKFEAYNISGFWKYKRKRGVDRSHAMTNYHSPTVFQSFIFRETFLCNPLLMRNSTPKEGAAAAISCNSSTFEFKSDKMETRNH